MLQSYAVDSILEGADMTNAVVDRVDFSNAKLKGAKFVNAVVTGGWGTAGCRRQVSTLRRQTSAAAGTGDRVVPARRYHLQQALAVLKQRL